MRNFKMTAHLANSYALAALLQSSVGLQWLLFDLILLKLTP
jgi:hypothetical protein